MKSFRKKRVVQHIMEDESYKIVKKYIPKEWVIREFNKPDYGIDIVIELFNKINEEIYETLGEYIYVQVKSVKSISTTTEKIFNVGNVAKSIWNEDKSEYMEIDVVKYVFDSESIFTIQSLGGSVSVLLFVVDLANENVYFMCMNDYIDKIILPRNPDYTTQQSLTITIPAFNSLQNADIQKTALKFYGKRAKLLAAFSKFSFQKNELAHALGYKFYPVWTYRDELQLDMNIDNTSIKKMLLYFISQIENLDIWEHEEWAILLETKKQLIQIKLILSEEKEDWNTIRDKVIVQWHQLSNLGTMYEDICREWFLPKMISLMTSYPTVPEIKKTEK